MTDFLFANDAQSTLAAPLSAAATSVTLAAGTGSLFPNPGAGEQFALTLIDAATRLVKEIVYCTARVVDTLTIVRAREGTVALDWLAGDIGANLNTAGTMRSFSQVSSSSGVLLSTQILTTSQVPTYPAGTASVDIELIGGGASGGGTPATGPTEGAAASGGGAAAFIKGTFAIADVEGEALVIGAGAPPGIAAADGNDGNNSTFGSTKLVAPGGRRGFAGSAISQNGVTGSSGNTNLPTATITTVTIAAPGAASGLGFVGDESNVASGQGGASFYGPGASQVSNGPGTPGVTPGSGGSGSSATANGSATVGGQGADGQCIIRSYS